MKIRHINLLIAALAASVALSGCAGLGAKLKNLSPGAQKAGSTSLSGANPASAAELGSAPALSADIALPVRKEIGGSR